MSGRRGHTLGVALLVCGAGLRCGGNSERSENDGAKKATGGSASGATSTGGMNPTGRTGAGGTTVGTGGTPSGTGGSDGIAVDCGSIKSNMPCPIDGVVCENLTCGPGGVGVRECACATTWTCTACEGVDPWPPAPEVPLCPPSVVEGSACTEQGSVCGPVGDEYCACYLDVALGLIWGCYVPPSGWPQ